MSDNRIAHRYAASLLQLAITQGNLERVYADMKFLAGAIKANRELLTLFKSPVVKADAKIKILNNLFKEGSDPLSNAFLGLVVRKRREDVVPAMAVSFERQYNEYKGIVKAKLETASAIDDTLRADILKIISSETHKEVLMETAVNPDLIAGFVLTVGDQRYEATVARELKELKKLFSDNPYIQKY